MPDPRPSDLESLRNLTCSILDPQRPIWSLREEVLEIARILASSATIPTQSHADISHGESRTAHGLALSPKMAAMCADDFARTVAFIRGTHAAITEVRSRNPNRPARILYAGCGPYATLAVPLMSLLSPEEASFTLLDVHPASVESVRSIVTALNLTALVATCEAMDASSYRADPDQMPDIFLLEIMRACLESEPQVAITRHLLSQAPDAILIPEEVRIDLVLVDVAREFAFDSAETAGNAGAIQRDRIPVAPAFILNRQTVASWQSIHTDRLPGLAARLPDSVDRRYVPMLFTHIRVYQDHMLKDYDSGLTTPRVFSSTPAIKPGDTIQFHYHLGPHPRLISEVQSSS